MIEYTPEQFKRCLSIWQNTDSTLDGVHDMLKVLGLDASQITGDEWCDFVNKITDAARKTATAVARGPHPSTLAAPCDCTERCTCTSRPPNVERMYELATSMADTYARKNADYGDSFHTSVQKYGLIAALTRMSDKWNRLENLMLHGNGQVNESITDTLIDLASYALMTIMEIEK